MKYRLKTKLTNFNNLKIYNFNNLTILVNLQIQKFIILTILQISFLPFLKDNKILKIQLKFSSTGNKYKQSLIFGKKFNFLFETLFTSMKMFFEASFTS